MLLGGTNAIRINGAGNHVVGNTVSGSQRGIRIDGIENRVVDNVIAGVAEGIEVRGASNQIRRNQIAGAIDQGIELRGAGNGSSPPRGRCGWRRHQYLLERQPDPRQRRLQQRRRGIIVVAPFGNNRIVNNRASATAPILPIRTSTVTTTSGQTIRSGAQNRTTASIDFSPAGLAPGARVALARLKGLHSGRHLAHVRRRAIGHPDGALRLRSSEPSRHVERWGAPGKEPPAPIERQP